MRPGLVLVLAVLGACARGRTDLHWQWDPDDNTLLVSEGTSPVLRYVRTARAAHGDRGRGHYLHPLFDLDGNVRTEDSPADHRHQHGVFWAWHQVLLGDRPLGDPWEVRDFDWTVTDLGCRPGPGGALRLEASAVWTSPRHREESGAPIPLVQEDLLLTIHPAEAERRRLDFQVRLRALVEDLRLGGSADAKGYGGFSVRAVLPEDVVFLGRDGPVAPATNAVAAGPWVDLTGTFGLPTGPPGGLTILQHPSNPGHPQPWILRRADSMQNAVYPGRTPVALPRGAPLVLRYRVVLHRGGITAEQGERWQREYEAGDPPTLPHP